MVLKLRLARIRTPGGAKRHHPRYNIVLAHARSARDSLPLEVLGTYNPIPSTPVGAEPDPHTGKVRKQKDIKVDVDRARYWLGVGAHPSDTVWRLLSMIGLLPPKYLPTGEQTQNALRAVRFPTHATTSAEKREQRWQREEAKGPVMKAVEERQRQQRAGLDTGKDAGR